MKIEECLSIYQIAQRTGHSPQSIDDAIKRHEIEPEYRLPNGFRYFAPSVVEFLKQNMRKPKSLAVTA